MLAFVKLKCTIIFYMSDVGSKAGEFLSQIRKGQGLTLEAAAKRAFPPFLISHLSQIENGRVKSPGVTSMPRLAQAYGITITEVLGAFGVVTEMTPEAIEAIEADKAYHVGKAVLDLDDTGRTLVLGLVERLGKQVSTVES